AERLAEAAELLPGLRLLLGVGRRAAVRALEGVTEDPGQVGRVGGAEREPGVAGGDRAVARQDAYAEGQALVVARTLGRAGAGRHRGQDARALRPGGAHLPGAVLPLEHAALELTPAFLLGHRLRRARLEGVAEEPAPAAELVESRADKEQEREHRGDRVAGQP